MEPQISTIKGCHIKHIIIESKRSNGEGKCYHLHSKDHIHFKGKLPFIVLALWRWSNYLAFVGFLPSLNMIEVNVYQVLCHKHDSLYRQDSGQKKKKRSKVIPEIILDGNQVLFL